MRRWFGWPVLMVVVALLQACGGSAVEAGDCAQAVRLDGVVYIEYGYTDSPAQRHGTAARASCDDVGPDSRGVFFPGDAEEVPVWSFVGHDPSRSSAVEGSTGGSACCSPRR